MTGSFDHYPLERLRAGTDGPNSPHLTRYRRARLSPLAIEAGMGPSYYVGDVTSVFAIGAQGYLTRLHAAFAATYFWTEHLSTRGSFTMYRHRVRATRAVWDKFGFESDNGQLAVSAVYSFKPKHVVEEGAKPVSGYGLLGIGLTWFNPVSLTDGRRFATILRDSIGIEMPRRALVIPVGVGVNWHLTEDAWVGAEAVYHFAMTDYLDGARGGANDGYYLVSFRVGYQIRQFWQYGGYLDQRRRGRRSVK